MKRFKKIRQETQQLLQDGEGDHLDYKRNSVLDPEDLVAFANSERGGHILLGVEEQKDSQGRMIGVPVGVVLDDDLARNIQGKANSCVPPVKIEVAEENSGAETSFVRVDILPSKNRPHCTGSGTYKIRSLAGNKPLLPHEILDLLLTRESNLFLNRFSASTQNLLDSVNNLQDQIISEIEDTQNRLSHKLQAVADASSSTDFNADKSNNQHEKINYIELAAKDLSATKQFFETVFNWAFTDYGEQYSAFNYQGVEGGFYQADLASNADNGGALIVFYSDALTATQIKIEQSGGTIVKPIFSFPGGKRFHFTEPSGNEFAVWGDASH